MAKHIDTIKLNQLIREGKSVKDCASFFRVSSSAICQAKKKLHAGVVKNVALENAHRVVNKNLDVIEQLEKINRHANELLDVLIQHTRGEKDTKPETPANHTKIDSPELALKTMSEIRNQLRLQMDIFQALYDLKAVAEFQQEVLAAIGEASPDVRKTIIRRLEEKRAIRTAVYRD